MKKICIIVVYFGKFPNFLDFYLKTCSYNPTINWLIYTNCKIPENYPQNIKFIKGTKKKFSELASKKLGFKVSIKNPYKLCDFKPTYGILFEEQLKKFDFWGTGDLDLFYGNIRKFITNNMLKKYEIITARADRMVGHFTLYKNIPKINYLFKKTKNYKKVFQSKEVYGFDERNQIIRKKKSIKEDCMQDLVSRLINKKELKVFFKTIIEEYVCVNWDKNWKFYWAKGKLVNLKNLKQVMYFHFLETLNNKKIPKKIKGKPIDYFIFSEKGIFPCKKINLKLYKLSLFKNKLNKKINRKIGQLGLFIKKYDPKFYYGLKKLKTKQK